MFKNLFDRKNNTKVEKNTYKLIVSYDENEPCEIEYIECYPSDLGGIIVNSRNVIGFELVK